MIRILLLIFTLFIIVSCDSRIEELDQFNDPPYFVIESDTITAISDSLKLSHQHYTISPMVVDANDNIVRIEFIAESSKGILKVDGETVERSIDIKSPTSLSYHPTLLDVDGSHSFTIRVIDAFNASADLDVNLTAFVNIIPTLIVDILYPPNRGPFEILIDASASFDGDHRFGGRIIEYEYTFLNITRNIKDSSQTVIFPSTGNYQVQVRVKDNDGFWTDLKTIAIQIN